MRGSGHTVCLIGYINNLLSVAEYIGSPCLASLLQNVIYNPNVCTQCSKTENSILQVLFFFWGGGTFFFTWL